MERIYIFALVTSAQNRLIKCKVFYVYLLSLILFQIVVPPLPGKAWKRQMPFRNDDGIFEEEFIEERRKGLEVFINKLVHITTYYLK